MIGVLFFFSSRRRHTRWNCDWSSDVCSSDLPGSTDAWHLRLPTEFAFCTHFASHTGYFAGERIELVHHRVDGVFEFENFAFHVDCDFARQVAPGDGCGHFGNVSNLAGEVASHRVHGVCEILPRSGDAGNVGLTTESSFGTYFASHTRYFAGEAVELVDHRVKRFFQLKDFAAHVDRDLAGEVATGNRGCDFGDVTYLTSEVAGHEVHVVGEILPRTADAGHLRLASEFAFRTDFASHAGNFAGEGVELVDHRVDGVFEFENFAFHIDGNFAGEITTGHSGGHFCNVSDL